MLARLRDNGGHLRRAGKVISGERKLAMVGETGYFQADLKIGGLSEERREEIITKLEEITGNKRMPPVDDGNLRLRGMTAAVPLRTAALLAIGHFAQLLREAEVDAGELLNSTAEFDLVPMDAPDEERSVPGGLRGRLAARAEATSYGIMVAAAEMFDRGARQEHGDRTAAVGVSIDNLEADACARVAAVAETKFRRQRNEDAPVDAVEFVVQTNRIGGPVGALLLAARGIGDVLAATPAAAELHMLAVPRD